MPLSRTAPRVLTALAWTILGVACGDGGRGGAASPSVPAPDVAAPPRAAPAPASLPGSASPEEAFDRLRAAQETGDYRGYHDALTPEARAHLLPATVLYGWMEAGNATAAEGPAARASLADLLRRRGADPAFPGNGDDPLGAMARAGEAFRRVDDPGGLYADVVALLDRHGIDTSFRRRGPLGPVEVEGDAARATAPVLHDDGTSTPEEVTFRRVDGRWFVHVGR